MKLPPHVTICEVGTRDGFQIEPEFIPTEQKIEVVNRLAEAGMPRIEVTSFVSPKAIPQLRDAAEVMAAIARRPGTVAGRRAGNPLWLAHGESCTGEPGAPLPSHSGDRECRPAACRRRNRRCRR